MLYRDSVSRISLAQVRAQFTPREFRKLTSVTVRLGDAMFPVALVRTKGHGCITGDRVWWRCHCGALAVTISIMCNGIGCRACTPWRSRSYGSNATAPHVGPIDAFAPGTE